ncbi:hypothetical protein, partial [Ferrimicrobium acidiphilum]|uniref:hypothetical protein n=1 Tax=Ferrimicrobium acidiphilum TaxID=121039 RepID=UPI0023F3F39B
VEQVVLGDRGISGGLSGEQQQSKMTVNTFSQAAQRPDDCPVTAHIHELSQRLAEVTLDSLRSRYEE